MKNRWGMNDSKYRVAAGGMFIYDQDHFWVIEETIRGKKIMTDIGGRYSADDGNIWSTIRREAYEETYGLIDVKVKDITKYKDVIEINDENGMCIYVCVCIPVNDIFDEKEIENLETMFLIGKKEFEKYNPGYSYKTLSLKKVKYANIPNIDKSYRLRNILRQFLTKNEKIIQK